MEVVEVVRMLWPAAFFKTHQVALMTDSVLAIHRAAGVSLAKPTKPGVSRK